MIKWLLIIVIVVGLAGGGFWYWKHADRKAVDYKTEPVTMGDLIQMVTATGQLNPKTNVQVGSQVSGLISKLNVDFNARVTKGETIAQLDPSTYKAMETLAKADLASAKAALELAQAEEERENTLYQSKIVAKADFDTAIATLHQAQATVMMKQAALEQAQANLSYTTIYAPVDGVVISRNVDVGQTVAASMTAPTLYMIANDLTTMQIDALVSEADIGGVETNQPVNFTVDAFPTRTFQGTVVQIRNAPQTNQNVITYDTVIAVDNSELKLRPGMTANVSIITAQTSDALRIPNAALRFHPAEAVGKKRGLGASPLTNGMPAGGGTRADSGAGPGGAKPARTKGDKPTRTIYVVQRQPDDKPPIAKPIQVKIGINDAINTQVLEGLKEGDEVIVGEIYPMDSAQGSANNPFGGGRRF